MSSSSTYGTAKSVRQPSSTTTLAVWFVVLVAGAVCFSTGIKSLLEAWTKAEYSHGYIIPAIAIYIALVRSRTFKNDDFEPSKQYLGTGLLGVGVLFGAFGTLSAIPDIVTYGLLIGIAGLILSVLGWRNALRMWPAWVYLAFMLPLPNFIYWPLSIKLQFLSSEIGVWLIQLMGISVFLEGNIIDLGVYKLQVAEACSGLRYLFPLMSFGFLFAIFYAGNWWQKLILFLSTIPITIAMNSLRIAVIGVLVNSYGNEQAEGFLHFFEGWVVFVLCIALLYAEAILLMKLWSPRSRATGLFDLGFDGLSEDVRRWLTSRATPALFASALLLACSALAWSFAGERQSLVPERTRFDQFPLSKSEWTGKRQTLEPDIERVLGADDYLVADFNKLGERAPVNFLVSYYNSQTSGSGIHSPEVCIPAGGWEVSEWQQTRLKIGGNTPVEFDVNRAIIQKGQSRQLVYYWFEQRGRRLTSDYVAKAYTVWDSAAKGRSDGALVRVVTSIDGKDIAGAEERLRRFLEYTLPKLPKFVPP
jgi:exosortase D (VPLPA-CTERM-specific)